MRRLPPIAALALLALLSATVASSQTGEKQPQCAADLASCGAGGCSKDNHHDPELNKLKNITAEGGALTDRTLAWMKSRPNPKHYTPQGDRGELGQLGEGSTVRVVGYLLVAKPELGGESCNCYIRTAAGTDNHLVLVTKGTLDEFPLPPNASANVLKATFKKREPESATVEFTPRVRLGHPNFTAAKINPIINRTEQGALLVRVTGQLMFDSEHFTEHKLVRVNNWEIHPVFKLEYCPKGKKCTAAGDANWVDLDK